MKIAKKFHSFAFIILLTLTLGWVEGYSQDLFGTLSNLPTSYITKGKVTLSGDIFITVWGGGVYKSGNNGDTWSLQSTGLNHFLLTDIEFIGSSEAIVSTMGGGIYKTTSMTNINWKQSNSGLTNMNVKTIKTYPNGWIMIGTYGGGIFLSKDKGNNWINVSQGLLYRDITSIEVADNGWVLAGTYGGGIFQSRDTTKSWTRQNSGLKNLFINDIKRSDKNYLYAATNGRGVYISVNDGIVWSELDTFMTRPLKVNPVPLPDLNTTCITFNSLSSPVFGSRYGGIYAEDLVEDMTWVPTNQRGIGVNSLAKWKAYMYSFFPFRDPYKTDGNGESWTAMKGETITNMGLIPKIFARNDREIIAYYQNYVKKTTDDGATWTVLGATPTPINKIAMDSIGNYYAATEKGLFRSDGSLQSWSLVKCLDTNVYDVEVSPRGSIFIITRYFKMPEPPATPIDVRIAWFTTDGTTWQKAPIDFDLREIPPTEVSINYNANVYISSNKAIYYSLNNGVNWIVSQTKFDKDVNSISFLRDNTVIVGTGGAGLWKSTLPGTFERIWSYPANSVEIVHVTRDNKIFASGTNILIDDAYSSYQATYASFDTLLTFVNINNNFNAEPITSFTSSKSSDFYMATNSGMIYRAINPANLKTPILLTLPDKAVDIGTGSVFSWTADPRADLYQLEISYNDDFSYVWESVTLSDTTYQNTIVPASYHKYYWRVRSKNHSAVSNWSPVRTFISKLETPKLHLPADKSLNIPVYAVLNWYLVEGSQKYKIQISEKSDFSSISFEWESNDTSTTSPLLKGRTKYYWRVMALNNDVTSNWSGSWSFETVFGPPLLLSPPDNSFGNEIYTIMTWEKASEVDEYDIQIASDTEFKNIVYEKNGILSLSTNLIEPLEFNKLYYWRVRSRNGQVTSEWSLISKFLTAYSFVTLESPLHESLNIPVNTEFTWKEHESVNSFEIEISKVHNFTNNVDLSYVKDIQNYTTDKLEPYQEYFWRVRAKSEENFGLWNQPFKFKTRVAKIGLRFPDNKTENHPVSIGFIWYQTKGAITYHLQIANDSEFNDLIFSQDTIRGTTHIFSQLNPGSDYFWRVRAVSPEGVGEWSEVWTFSTGSNIPVLLAPLNEKADVVIPVKFEWVSVAGDVKYELQVSELTTFTNYAYKKDDLTESQVTISSLEFPKVYYWRVRALSKDGTSPWSQVWRFGTVDPASVSEIINLNPANLYPNPATDMLNVILGELESQDIKVSISDINGNELLNYNTFLNGHLLKVDCSKLNSGIYHINIISSKKIYICEFIIVR